jgi:hypothetical protein
LRLAVTDEDELWHGIQTPFVDDMAQPLALDCARHK